MTGTVRSIPHRLVMVALTFLLTSAGCGQSTPPAPSSAASGAIVETPLSACTGVATEHGRSLSQGWAEVVGSKGSSDHRRRVERFADDAEKIASARYDAACADLGMMMVQLSSEASRLAAWVLIGDGEAELSRYRTVAEAGNSLMKRLGLNQQFDTPGVTGT